MKIYIDEELPQSCASCQFLVHCDECEGAENYCPFVGHVGYDISDNLINGAPVTPSWERHEECPLMQIPHEECNQCRYYDGVHGVQGHAPCWHWNIGGVMWNDYCSRFEKEGERE